MDDREELLALRRMAELEAKAGGDSYEQTAKDDSNTQNFLAAVGGAMKAPYVGIRQAMGMAQPGEVEDWQKSMAGLWSTPMGKVGTVAGGAATAAPLALVPGANTATGLALGGLAYGAAQPVVEGQTRATNAVEAMAGNFAGKYLGDALGAGSRALFGKKTAELAAAKAANATRDATVNEVRQAGYVIPPNQVSPGSQGAMNRLLEGISGKIQTGQAASIKNQQVTELLAKRDLGIPANQPLTVQTLQTVRGIAGKAYEQLKKFGPLQSDQGFGTDMQKVAGEYVSLSQNLPSQKIPQIDALLADLNKPTFSSADAVELVKRLRHDGFKNLRSPDPEVAIKGRIQIGAQNALEDLMDRELVKSGNAGFLTVFRRARTMIAKTHTYENALEESTGKLVASKIGKEFSKGRPLSGEAATIGKMAEAFPKAVQNVNTSMPGLSPLDAMGSLAALIGAVGTGNPNAAWLAAAPLARPAIRSAILSKPYQNAMASVPNYQVGLLGRGANDAFDNEATRRLLQSLGMSIPAMQE